MAGSIDVITSSNLPSEDGVQPPTSPHWEPSSPPIEGSSPVWEPSVRDEYLGASSPVFGGWHRHPPSDETRLRGAISPMQLPDTDERYETGVFLSIESQEAASRFLPLLKILQDLRKEGNGTPLRSMVGERLRWRSAHIYRLAGVSTFKAYVELAARAGLIDFIPPSNGPGTERMTLREILL